MKDDKICFSKTLTYLVLLVAVVFGAFWVMNAANTSKVGSMPQAGTTCNATFAGYDNGCERVQPRLDKLNDGSVNSPTKEYTGRQCVAVVNGSTTTYEWQDASTGTCLKSNRCVYGEVTYYRSTADNASNFDSTNGSMCALNANGTLVGVQCIMSNGKYISKSTATCAASTARTKCQVNGVEVFANGTADKTYTLGAGTQARCILENGNLTGLKCDPATFRNVKDSVCSASTARAQCQVDGVQVYANGTANQSYTFGTGAQARCIYYKGGLTGFKCDASTFKNTRDTVCTTSTGRTQCQVDGVQVYANGTTGKDYTFGTGAQSACIYYKGGLTGFKCDGATFRNTKDAACASSVAACSGTCGWYDGPLANGTCGEDANGAFWKCACKSGSSFASLTGPYSSCP